MIKSALAKSSKFTILAIFGGGLLGLMANRGRRRNPVPMPSRSSGDVSMRRLTAYFVAPVWMAAAFLDYLWHRRTKIETTSGLNESLMHTLMMIEAGPAVLAPLFLEVNAGVLAARIGFSVLHELTVWWDLAFTTPRRLIPAGEQVIHTFLEAPPFLVSAAAIATHWRQFLALLGRGSEAPRFAIRMQKPPARGLQSVVIVWRSSVAGRRSACG